MFVPKSLTTSGAHEKVNMGGCSHQSVTQIVTKVSLKLLISYGSKSSSTLFYQKKKNHPVLHK
jgi:hypothetical protein